MFGNRRLGRIRGRHHIVVAYLALFLALGGSAIAAKPLIDSADVQDESLTGADVQNSSLTGDDINEASLGEVPSATSADSASTASDADMLDGKDSTAFYSRFTRVAGPDGTLEGAEGSTLVLSATCPTGAYPVSGGLDDGFTSIAIGRSRQLSNGWEIYVSRIRSITNSNDLRAFVICATKG